MSTPYKLIRFAFLPLLILSAGRAIAQVPPTAPPPAAPVAGALTLADATSAAAAANPIVRSAQEQLTQTQARFAQAQAQQRFQISLNTAVGVSNGDVYQPPPSSETFGSLINTVTIPLPIGRRGKIAVRQANRQIEAAQAVFDAARLSLATQVATAYYDLLRKQALLQVAQETRANAQRQLDEAQKRYRAGDVPELDVLRAQNPVALATTTVLQADVAVATARQTLNGLVGKPIDAPLQAAELTAPTGNLPLTLEEARERALKNSADLRAAEATVSAQDLARQGAGLSREPTYSLQGSDSRSKDITGFSRLDTVQVAITFPLNDGGLGRAQVREAESALAQARAQIEVTRNTVLVAVSNAYLTAQSSLKQIEAARTAQEIAQSTYQKTERGYQTGLFPLTDVLSAQSALTQARIAYTQTIYDAAAAITTLNNATGNNPNQP